MARSAASPAPLAEKGQASQLIRERLLSGEPFSVPQLADEFGVTKGLVTSVLMKFRQSGYDVRSVSKPYDGRRMKHYFVTERSIPAAAAEVDESGEPAQPALGQMLVVALLALGPQGELRIGLRDDSRDTTYVCTLDGTR